MIRPTPFTMIWIEQSMPVARPCREDPLRWRTVADLAQFCHCSPDYLTRRFKARRLVSPAQFLTDVRMEHARVMLRYTTMSAGQIAEAIGYGDPAYFNRVFTRQHHAATSMAFAVY